jgi:hypothetical protein
MEKPSLPQHLQAKHKIRHHTQLFLTGKFSGTLAVFQRDCQLVLLLTDPKLNGRSADICYKFFTALTGPRISL